MPMFEFQCPKCRRIVEKLLGSASYADVVTITCLSPTCPGMKQARMVRIPSVAGFVLKGAGFHVNDYKKP